MDSDQIAEILVLDGVQNTRVDYSYRMHIVIYEERRQPKRGIAKLLPAKVLKKM